MKTKSIFLGIVFFAAGALSAQNATPPAEPAPAAAAGGDVLNEFKFHGLVRVRPEIKNNFDFNKKTNDRQDFIGQKVQLGLQYNYTKDVFARITIQDGRVLGGQPGSATGLNTGNDSTAEATDIREGFIEVKHMLGPLGMQIGRQILVYGDQRLLGHLDWTNVGRSFDGLRLKFETSVFDSHLFGMVLSEDDNDSVGNNSHAGSQNPPAFSVTCADATLQKCQAVRAKTLYDAYLTGWYNTIKASKFLHADLYMIGLHKRWYPKKVIGPFTMTGGVPPATSTQAVLPYMMEYENSLRKISKDDLITYGIRLTNKTNKGKAEGPVDFSVEYAVQRGHTGETVNPDWDILEVKDLNGDRLYKQRQIYDANAFMVDVGLSLGKSIRIGVEYDRGSGDPNRGNPGSKTNGNDDSVGTFNNLFPTNHLFYGQGDQVSLQNIRAYSGNLTLKNEKWGTLKLASWKIDKDKAQDSWYNVGGAPVTAPILNNPAAIPTSTFLPGKTPPSATTADYTTASPTNDKYGEVGYLKKELMLEYDLTYTYKYNEKLSFEFGYSLMLAQNSIRHYQDDLGYQYFVRDLYPSLDPAVTTTTSTGQKQLGQYVFYKEYMEPTSDPKATFVYLMTTFKI